MGTVAHARRCLAWLAIALVLLTAFSPAAGVLFAAGIVPIQIFAGNLVSTRRHPHRDEARRDLCAFHPALSPRAPPLAR